MNNDDLTVHMKVHDTLDDQEVLVSFPCNQCHNTFTSNSLLQAHIHEIHPYFQCELCSVITGSVKELMKHIKYAHTAHFHEIIQTNVNKCNVCSYETSSLEFLNEHIELTHTGNPCSYCDHRAAV